MASACRRRVNDGQRGFREESSVTVSWVTSLFPPPSYCPLFTAECFIFLMERPCAITAPPLPPLGFTQHPERSPCLPLGSSNQITFSWQILEGNVVYRPQNLEGKAVRGSHASLNQEACSCTYRASPSQAPSYSPQWGHFMALSITGSDAEAQCFGPLCPQELPRWH